jgi:uncharacterized phage protein (TIGR01671 family)
MNRIIKFRAWDSNRNYFLPLDDDGDYYFRDDNNGLELWDKSGRCKAAILQQFIGRLDNKGKEIYQNDIVMYSYDEEDYYGVLSASLAGGISIKGLGIVYFRGTKNQELKPSENKKEWWANGFSNLEIIGSIYENPELLNS